MAVLKSKDASKLSKAQRAEKMDELKTEIIKARVSTKKTSKMNVREIKKAMARLLTLDNMEKIKSKPVKKGGLN